MIVARLKDMVNCFHILTLIMLAIAVASLLRIEKNVNVISLDNYTFSKTQQNTTQNICNLSSGRWIYDNVSYPLYKERDCSLIGVDFTCEKYGREDLKYQNWRWQPHHCDLPRFNGTTLLEKLRNKKLIFVGDSLNRNQWVSLMCLIEPELPQTTNKIVVLEGNLLKLHVEDYNATIGFYWSPYLAESDADDVYKHNQNQRTVRIKSIEKHGRHWNDADILIFDTFVWWAPKMTIMWGSFEDPNAVYQKVESERPYEIVISTWANWLEYHINRNKTRIFFTSASPLPIGSWGINAGCYNITEPIFDDIYWRSHPKAKMKVVESTIEKLKIRGVQVEYLNITQLSSYRQDAYQSIHTRNWKNVHLKARDPAESDCRHWCLPGVPDVWNQILYASIIKF